MRLLAALFAVALIAAACGDSDDDDGGEASEQRSSTGAAVGATHDVPGEGPQRAEGQQHQREVRHLGTLPP